MEVETNRKIKDVDCDVVFSASGVLNNWKWPDIPGLQDFKGKLLHSAQWDTEWYVNLINKLTFEGLYRKICCYYRLWVIGYSNSSKDAKGVFTNRSLRPWEDISQLSIWRRI